MVSTPKNTFTISGVNYKEPVCWQRCLQKKRHVVCALACSRLIYNKKYTFTFNDILLFIVLLDFKKILKCRKDLIVMFF